MFLFQIIPVLSLSIEFTYFVDDPHMGVNPLHKNCFVSYRVDKITTLNMDYY